MTCRCFQRLYSPLCDTDVNAYLKFLAVVEKCCDGFVRDSTCVGSGGGARYSGCVDGVGSGNAVLGSVFCVEDACGVSRMGCDVFDGVVDDGKRGVVDVTSDGHEGPVASDSDSVSDRVWSNASGGDGSRVFERGRQSEVLAVRGKWHESNKRKRERKLRDKWRSKSWRKDEVVSDDSDTVCEQSSDQSARESLRETWVLKNKLEAIRLRREIEIAEVFDVEAEVKRRQSAVRKQTERNLAETEKHHRFLVRTGNVPGEGRPDGVKVVNGKRMREVIVNGEVKYEEEGVSGGGYVEGTVLESCTIQPSSSASMKEYMAEKKRAEDEEKRRKDAEAKVKVLERQLASAGIGVKRDEVGNTEYSFSDGGDVTYRGKLQAAYRGKVVRVVKDSYGVPAVENVMAGAFGDGSDTLSDACIREVERYEEEVRRSKCL